MSSINKIFAILALIISVGSVAESAPFPYDASTWQVGDHLNYKIKSENWDEIGTFQKRVVRVTGTSVWVRSFWKFNILGARDVESLVELSKITGEMLDKYINGKKELPDTMAFTPLKLKRISVPAGNFQCMTYAWDTSADLQGATNPVLCLDSKQVGMDGTIEMTAEWRGDIIHYELVAYSDPR